MNSFRIWQVRPQEKIGALLLVLSKVLGRDE